MPTTAAKSPQKAGERPVSKKSPRRGRPTKFSEALWESILALAAEGLPMKWCCLRVGISPDTAELWRLARPELEHRLQVAQSLAVANRLKRIEAAAIGSKAKPGDWRADSWLLEKCHPMDFQTKPGIEVNNNVTTNNTLQITLVECREIESRTAAVDAQVAELFNRRKSVRDLE
jgi:hypothetical protein